MAISSLVSWALSALGGSGGSGGTTSTGKKKPGFFTSTHKGGKFNYMGFANPYSTPEKSKKEMIIQNFTDPAGVLGWFGGGGGEEEPYIEPPEYYEDPDYRLTQDYLGAYGMNLMRGEVPEYYKAIGETGSPEFENMLGMTKRDITQSTAEALARGGRARGGQLGASTAKAISDASTTARYQDYERSLAGKQSLLGLGTSITEGARAAGQREGASVNKFAWDQYLARSRKYDQLAESQKEQEQATGEMIGTVADAYFNRGTDSQGNKQSFLGSLFGRGGASTTSTTSGANITYNDSYNIPKYKSIIGSVG